ncbi:MAG: MurR/RpiR family transcriptional regulator [Motiliproteus sp.]
MSLKCPVLPDTLAGLRSLLDEIERGERDIRLGKRSHQVLLSMLQAPQQTAVMTIVELSQQLGVNASTLSRLAQRLGYEKYSQLQELFRREMAAGKHFYSEQAGRLNQASDDEELGLLAQLGRQESSNIATLIDAVDAADFEATATLMSEAKRVRIHGMRQFYSLSLFISYALGMLRQDVAPLDAGRQGVADALAQLQPGDLLILVSCFPYTQSVLKTAEVAAQLGIRVVALTDSSRSPLTAVADYSFFVPNQSAFFSNSMCGFMLLSEGLLSRAASLLGDTALDSLRQREVLIEQLAASL